MKPMVSALRWGSWTGLVLAAALSGCSSVPLNNTPPPVESRDAAVATAAASGAASTGTANATTQSKVTSVDLTANGAGAKGSGANTALATAPVLGRVVFFDFDSFVIRDEFNPLIEGHAKALAGDKLKQVVIEGHTDERGGREYNLALGQKRAEAVQKALVLLGASERQIEAVSYGEERPADPGHDEAAWAKNRRAELKDR